MRSPGQHKSGRFRSPFGLLRTRQVPRTLRRVSQLSTTFRPQVFSTSRRFSPHLDLRVCFAPLPRPGLFPVQGLLSPRSHPASSAGASSLPFRSPSLSIRRQRPRWTPSGPRPCSTRRSVPGGTVVSRAARPLPSSGSPPPGPAAFAVAGRSPGSRPLMRFARSPFACALADRMSSSAYLLRKP